MQYLLLLHADQTTLAARPAAETAAIMAEYDVLIRELRAAGQLLGAQRLHPAGTIARVRDGELQITDGPFAETREQLGGYFLVDVPDRDAAVRIARRIPAVRLGTIEIREVAVTA